MFQRGDVILVERHGFFIAACLVFHLRAETFGLILRVVQLGKAIGDFATADKKLEAVGDQRIGVAATCQR